MVSLNIDIMCNNSWNFVYGVFCIVLIFEVLVTEYIEVVQKSQKSVLCVYEVLEIELKMFVWTRQLETKYTTRNTTLLKDPMCKISAKLLLI